MEKKRLHTWFKGVSLYVRNFNTVTDNIQLLVTKIKYENHFLEEGEECSSS